MFSNFEHFFCIHFWLNILAKKLFLCFLKYFVEWQINSVDPGLTASDRVYTICKCHSVKNLSVRNVSAYHNKKENIWD